MRRKTLFSALLALSAAFAGVFTGGAAMAAELKVGDVAPAFTLPGSDGKTYTLADLKGQAVIVAWYPKALTGG